MVNSNAKGAGYERGICGKLSLWVTNMQREDIFWRSAMSGGRANVPSRRRGKPRFSGQAGDIVAVQAEGMLLTDHFVLECKHLKRAVPRQALYGMKGPFGNVWDILQNEAIRAKKYPLLFFRENRVPDLVAFDHRGLEMFEAAASYLTLQFTLPKLDCHGMLLRDLLTDVDFDEIRRLYG